MLRYDKHGILLADVAPSGVSRIDPNAKSGNPRHDTRSGKFGTGGNRKASEPPPNADPLQYARMLDAVRDAARQFDVADTEQIQAFLQDRAANPEQVDLENFLEQVRQQKLSDLVDSLDSKLVGEAKPRTRFRVKVQVSPSYTKKFLNTLTDQEFAEVQARLLAKGHSEESLAKLFKDRTKPEEEPKAEKT